MLQISINEYGKIAHEAIGLSLLRGLQKFDEQHALKSGDTIFDWSRQHFIKAKSYVGVLQIPGLSIEILPKTDNSESLGDESKAQVRRNLLYMLCVAGELPLHERELASQGLQNVPMLEALTRVFVRELLTELRRGQQHLYLYREENLPYVKGRILMAKQVAINVASQHMTYVGYDEFMNDTWLNRILKAACKRLLSITRLSRTQQYLREGMLELADVEVCTIEPHHFDRVLLDRNSERFRKLLDFCRLLFLGATPTPQAGHAESFSLLFPMEVLFEEFIGNFLRRHAADFGLKRSDIHLQARGRGKWLLRDQHGKGKFRLKPDVLIDGEDGKPAIILDTKWKRLLSDEENSKNGVSQADIYQLYAYSQRYECPNNILLFPQVSGVSPKRYQPDGNDETAKFMRVEFVNLDFDLRSDLDRFKSQIRNILDAP
jgi:5-methylcytosine-specific restriction enzyme subunit McrC